MRSGIGIGVPPFFQSRAAGGGPSYEGPLDLVPGAVAAYSQRALSAAVLEDPLYTLRRLDDTQQSFNSGADGDAPVAAIAAFVPIQVTGAIVDTSDLITLDVLYVEPGQGISGTGIPPGTTIIDTAAYPVLQISAQATATNPEATLFISGNIFVDLWNDQSGNDFNVERIGFTTTPKWFSNVQGGKPAFGGSGTLEVPTLEATFPSGAATIFIVARGAANLTFDDGDNGVVEMDCGEDAQIIISNVDSDAAGGDFSSNGTDDGTFYLWEVSCTQGATSYLINGVPATEQSSYDNGGAIGALTYLVIQVFVSSGANGRAQEYIAYDGIKSVPDRLALRENIAAYYGIAL